MGMLQAYFWFLKSGKLAKNERERVKEGRQGAEVE